MRVLVSGASGFLGRQVAKHFIGLGWEVTGFDLVPAPAPLDLHARRP
jgi:nucleoside-diphosphate-sugar epimerase